MDIVYVAVVACAAVHTATFGLWLGKQGNKAGALFAYSLAALCLGLPLYRLIFGH